MNFSVARLVSGLIVIIVLIVAGLWWHAGSQLSAPTNHAIGPAPDDLSAKNVEFDGVKGWLISSGSNSPCIVLMHGVRADRTSMVDRARLFKAEGYSVLLFDFQAHGESPGDKITFGYREAANAESAVNFIKANASCSRTVALGASMGGAAALLGPKPLAVDALVLESVYPTIEEAVQNRMVQRFGALGKNLTPLLIQQLPMRLKIEPANMRPIDRIGELRCPVLVLGGKDDPLTPPDETMRLFDQAPGPKSYWLVPGAGHEDLYHVGGKDYEQHVLEFLNATRR
jgi:fermentation-respiration switch protein FrsA (DUF1100 family)